MLILPQHCAEVLQSLVEALVNFLQGFCRLGVPPAPGITPLGRVLVHMELAGLEIQHSLEEQGVGIVLPGRQLEHLVDVLFGLIKVLSVQI